MSDTKHTPGPWLLGADLERVILNRRDEYGNSHPDNCTKNGWAKHVCRISHGSWSDIEERVANGRLIAAAPDMLAALTECSKQLTVIIDDGIPTDFKTWRDDIDAAIARATL